MNADEHVRRGAGCGWVRASLATISGKQAPLFEIEIEIEIGDPAAVRFVETATRTLVAGAKQQTSRQDDFDFDLDFDFDRRPTRGWPHVVLTRH